MASAQPWANVAVFEELPPAESLTAFLEKQRIEARIHDDRALQIYWFWSPPHLTYRVQVREKFLGLADKILTKEVPPMLAQAAQCPACGSLKVNYPQMTRKSILPMLMWHIGVIFRVLTSEARCEECQHTWSLKRDGDHKTHLPKPFLFK